jgi:hypothetical protein
MAVTFEWTNARDTFLKLWNLAYFSSDIQTDYTDESEIERGK